MNDYKTLKGLLNTTRKAPVQDKTFWLSIFFAQLGVARTTGCALLLAFLVGLLLLWFAR